MKEELRPVPLGDLSRKAFREELNQGGYKHSHANNKYGNRKRAYGEYLYNQDRDKFEADYAEWVAEKGKTATKDHVTLLPVPDGTSELRYGAKDLGKHAFERDGDNSTCKICGERLAADIHRSDGKLIPVGETPQKKRCAKCDGKGVVRGGFGGGSWVSCPACTTEAKDSVSSAALLGALIAAIAWLYRPRETVAPSDYDLRNYQPRRRDW